MVGRQVGRRAKWLSLLFAVAFFLLQIAGFPLEVYAKVDNTGEKTLAEWFPNSVALQDMVAARLEVIDRDMRVSRDDLKMVDVLDGAYTDGIDTLAGIEQLETVRKVMLNDKGIDNDTLAAMAENLKLVGSTGVTCRYVAIELDGNQIESLFCLRGMRAQTRVTAQGQEIVKTVILDEGETELRAPNSIYIPYTNQDPNGLLTPCADGPYAAISPSEKGTYEAPDIVWALGQLPNLPAGTVYYDFSYLFDLPRGDTFRLEDARMHSLYFTGRVYYNYCAQAAVYHVTYSANGAQGAAPVDRAAYAKDAEARVLGQGSLSRAGYAFAGWNTAPNGSGRTYLEGETLRVVADTTLYAVWKQQPVQKYTVSYHANGAQGSPPVDRGAYEKNAVVRVLGQGSLSRTGYTFTGWNTAPDGSGRTYLEGETFQTTADTTLYAVWKQQPATQYTVMYDANGGAGAPPVDGGSYAYGATVVVKGPNSLTREGYIFAGWNTTPDAPGAMYTEGTTFSIIGNTRLYAYWVPVSAPPAPVSSSASASSSAARPASSSAVPSSSSSSAQAPSSSSEVIPVVPAIEETPQGSPPGGSSDDENAQTLQELKDNGVPILRFGGLEMPLYAWPGMHVWSFLNLLIMLACGITAVVTTVIVLGQSKTRREEYDDDFINERGEIARGRKGGHLFKLLGIIAGMGTVILFFAAQNLQYLMVFVDVYSPLFMLFAIAQFALLMFSGAVRRDRHAKWDRRERTRRPKVFYSNGHPL